MTNKPHPDIGFGDTVVDEAYRICIMSTDDEGILDLEKIADRLTVLRASNSMVQEKFISLITEEMVYDDGDMYYKVNPEKYVNLLEELRGEMPT